MPSEEETYLVLFPDCTMKMTSGEIKDIIRDAKSWVSFLGMLLKKQRFARMILIDPVHSTTIIVKVVPAGSPEGRMSYAALI